LLVAASLRHNDVWPPWLGVAVDHVRSNLARAYRHWNQMGGESGWPESGISAACAEAIHKAKKEIRSELKPASWSRRGYWRPNAPALPEALDNLERIHCRDVTPEEFYERFEVPARPVVIDGFAEGTPAEHWTAQGLLEKYAEMKFKCGEDDEGYPERVKLKHFMEYCATEGKVDDSPLYVFDSRFGDRGDGKSLLNDYRLP
jgi:histone arginine demethylase JMJD6